jgi:hypothetical protein
MDKTVEAMEQATNTVKQLVQKAFYDAVTDGLIGAFDDSFKKITTDQTKWFKAELDSFKTFLEKVADLFKMTWLYILDTTQEAVDQGIKTSIESAMKDLEALSLAVENLKSVKAQVAKEEADKAKQVTPEGAKAEPQNMMDAVARGMEQWFGPGQQYRDDFMTQPNKIADAVAKLGVIQVSGGGGAGTAATDIRRRGGPWGPNSSDVGRRPVRP